MSLPIDPKQILEMARDFQRRIAQMKADLGRMRVEADAGAGMVRVVANGLGEVLEVKIDPSAAGEGDVSMLEDLVKAAVNEVLRRAKSLAEEEQRKLTGGISLPMNLSGLGGTF